MFRYGRVKCGSADNVVSFGPDVVRIWYVGSATAQVLKPRLPPRLYLTVFILVNLEERRLATAAQDAILDAILPHN